MTRFKTMGLCLVAVFALGAFAASSAFATAEVGRCVAKAGTGKYKDANCTKKAGKLVSEKQFEWVKSAEKIKFTSAGGTGTLEAASGTNVVCTAQSAVGQYDVDGTAPAFSIKGVEKVVATFTGCAIPTIGIACNSAGQASGTIVTKTLAGNLGYVSGEKTLSPVVGQELTPEVKNGAFAEFECGGGAVKIVTKAATTNCVIATVGPPNVMSTTATQNYASEGGGKQAVKHFQATPTKICQLESKVNGGTAELSAQILETIVTNEETLEIKA
jgi:hypothetical protein